jgi:hypothetical protein
LEGRARQVTLTTAATEEHSNRSSRGNQARQSHMIQAICVSELTNLEMKWTSSADVHPAGHNLVVLFLG